VTEQPALGERLRGLRLAANVTIEALADRSGLSDRAISDIERGVSEAPQHRTIAAIAEALGLDEEERRTFLATARGARVARRAGAATPRNPSAASSSPEFTGRERELAKISATLTTMTTVAAPALLISGAPGVGKTATALEAVSRATAWSSHLFVDLDGFAALPATPTQILRELLRQLPGSTEQIPTTLDDAARHWRMRTERDPPLVVLDNAASESQVRPVLSLSPRGAVIVTSRRALAGLEGVARMTLGPLGEEASIRLLGRLIANGLIANGRTTPQATVLVAQLVHGLPLAISIAAEIISDDPNHDAAHFASALGSADDPLAALVHGDRSVASAIALSYDTLSARSAQLLRDISVIETDTFDAILAGAIGVEQGGVEQGGVESRLDELADLGLLEVRGGDRFSLPWPVRHFALARLTDTVGPRGVAERRQRADVWLRANGAAAH